MGRRISRLSVLLVVVVSVAGLGFDTIQAATQPEPPRPAVAASQFLELYETAQSSPGLSDVEKIRVAVDTYFTLKYESLVGGCALNLGIVVDRSDSRGRGLFNYEMGRLQYYNAAWDFVGFDPTGYRYEPEYLDVTVTDNAAAVEVVPWAEVSYWPLPFLAGSEQHQVLLVRSSTGWVITDDRYSDPFLKTYPRGTDFAYLIRSVSARNAAVEETQTVQPQGDVGVLSIRSYNRGDACWYAETYALSYNGNFKSYAGSGGDCQNFVSQSVWYGFGGINTYNPYIQNHLLPMVDNWAGATDWWADLSTATNNWVNVGLFKDMARANYYNLVGVQGYWGSLTLTNCNCDYGDWVSTSSFSHAMIITSLPEKDGDLYHDYNEIYICGHTSNQKNVPLTLNCPTPADAKLLIIYRFLNPN